MTGQNKSEKAVADLKQRREQLRKLFDKNIYHNSDQFSYGFRKWKAETEYSIIQIFGEGSRELREFDKAASWQDAEGTTRQLSRYRYQIMVRAAAHIDAILSAIKQYGVSKTEETTQPKAFIAHGGKTEALSKLQSFLGALGIVPLIAEEEPSEARSVDEQVEWCLANADCVIILGTADDQNLKDGKLYPRPSVCIEIGRVQERFPRRVIYLLEQGASFPSNITEKVYERFTQENMENAFSKVAKELRAFGIMRATSLERQSE